MTHEAARIDRLLLVGSESKGKKSIAYKPFIINHI